MRASLTCFVAVLALGQPAATRAQAPAVSHQTILEQLVSFDWRVREQAIDSVLKLNASQRTPELERALVDELNRLNELVRSRREADRSGKRLEEDFPNDYYRSVVEAVTRSSDPVVVPALAGALGTGRMVQDALVKFGDAAVAYIFSVARSNVGTITTGAPGDTPPHVVADALTTLRLLVEQRAQGLSPQSRADINAVAGERLIGKQHGAVVAAACQLAVSTKDPGLRARVERIATNRGEVLALGISDAGWGNLVQKAARESLGVR